MLRGLDRQAQVLSELRQRSSIVLSASGIVASLLGGQALRGDYNHVLAVGALVLTALGIVACIWVLWKVRDEGKMPTEERKGGELTGGKRNWKVTIPGDRLNLLAAGSISQLDVLDELRVARRVNFRTLKQRSRVFVAACVLLLLQLILWSVTFLERTW
jgi:hypothetical protein